MKEDTKIYYPSFIGYVRPDDKKKTKKLCKFFNIDEIENREYRICVWIEGKEEDNKSIYPTGVPVELCLYYKNTVKYRKNIEGIFKEYGCFIENNEQKVRDWFEKKIF